MGSTPKLSREEFIHEMKKKMTQWVADLEEFRYHVIVLTGCVFHLALAVIDGVPRDGLNRWQAMLAVATGAGHSQGGRYFARRLAELLMKHEVPIRT